MKPEFTIYRAKCLNKETNCLYPEEVHITDEASLKSAVDHDYVCAKYANNYRSIGNFIVSDCVAMDLDNSHSEDSSDWITAEDIRKIFPDVTIGIHYSRNHLKQKGKCSPRPRFHVFFACEPIADATEYAALKERLLRVLPYFDSNAQDASRFFYGTREANCAFFPGTISILECLDMYYPENLTDTDDPLELWAPANPLDRSIPEGHRNATLSHFAGRILKRLGPTAEARASFLRRAAACEPPLEDEELDSIWHSALGFYERISHRDDYIAPEEFANNGRKYDPADRTDVGQAQLLASFASDRLLYCDQFGFLRYTGVYWEESENAVQGLTQNLTDKQLKEAAEERDAAWEKCIALGVDVLVAGVSKAKAIQRMDPAQQAAFTAYESALGYYKWAENRRASGHILATMQQVKSMVLVDPNTLDTDWWLLNCPEKTYDLHYGVSAAHEHKSSDLCTKVTAVEPGDEGMQLWQDSLDRTFNGDKELIDYVQQICGLACLGKVFYEALIIAYGDGRNGKSTFWNTVFRVLGTYGRTISAETLTTSCKRNTLPELAEVKGCRIVLASELKEGMSMNTSIVKQLTSTDPIHAEKKFLAPIDFIPTHTMVLYTNHLPRVRAMDNGTWRRLIVVPFTAHIDGKDDIKNYGDYLFTNAGGAVLKWIMEGAKIVIQNDFKIEQPAAVLDAISAYRESNDWLQSFIDDMCECDKTFQASSGQFYTAYRAYAERCGEFIRSTTDFYSAIASYGFTRRKTKVGSFISGIRLRTIENCESDEF